MMKKHNRVLMSFMLVFLISGLASVSAAEGGFWRVTGNLVNVNNGVTGLNGPSCPMANVRLRFKSRWLGGTGVGLNGPVTPFPWGTSWGTATTDSNGWFSETSSFFADSSRGRDILVEARVRGDNSQYEWKPVTIVRGLSASTPHQVTGNIHTFNLGEVETDLFECPTDLVPAPQPERKPKIAKVPNDKPNEIEAKIKPIPCGWSTNGKPGIDLTFTSVVVRHRDNQPNSPPERITWEVVVRNNGPMEYKGSGKCKTSVRMTVFISELGKEREYHLTLNKPIAAGSEKTFTSNSGNLGETSEAESDSYPILFEIDPENEISETDEGNNQLSGTYSPATETFSAQ
ncbi:MAG: CARDB domain-containing protein [Planctomycetota bacterium]|nr:CARDB domain-containing protein [Planctomycetota bacterium]